MPSVLKQDLVICDKHRERANEVTSMQLIGDVQQRDVILVDDMVDTAGTLCRAAKLLKSKGAKSVRAICTHPVLSGKAYENIENSELEELIVTNTLPINRDGKRKTSKIKVLTMANLFAKSIRKINDKESISILFD